jgi:hypothetical protein
LWDRFFRCTFNTLIWNHQIDSFFAATLKFWFEIWNYELWFCDRMVNLFCLMYSYFDSKRHFLQKLATVNNTNNSQFRLKSFSDFNFNFDLKSIRFLFLALWLEKQLELRSKSSKDFFDLNIDLKSTKKRFIFFSNFV